MNKPDYIMWMQSWATTTVLVIVLCVLTGVWLVTCAQPDPSRLTVDSLYGPGWGR